MTFSDFAHSALHLGYVILYVPDVEAAILFYESVFCLKRIFIHETKQYAELDTAHTTLAFASERLTEEENGLTFTKNRFNQPSAGFEITLVTDNVSDTYDKAIKAGAIAVKSPTEKPWGQVVAYVRDLNGVLVGICSVL
jgi:lactoylglutathione lyase